MNSKSINLKIWIGLITLYIVWGSTYLGTRFAVEQAPSMVVSAFRNLFAGIILFVFTFLSKNYKKPDNNFLITSLISGFLMLSIGNGFFAISAKWVPSSFNALFSAISPVLLVILLWISDKKKPNKIVVFGALLGLSGVGLLISQKNVSLLGYEKYYWWGVLLIFIGVLSWLIGVVYVKRKKIFEYSAIQIAAFQMTTGGVINMFFAFFLGNFSELELKNISLKAYASFAYLVIFGSVIGFLVFGWLSKKASPTLVATYTFVNPIVAIILGWLLASEPLQPIMILAAAIIIAAVFLISIGDKKNRAV